EARRPELARVHDHGSTDLVPIGGGDARRLVDVPAQDERRLVALDEAADGARADVHPRGRQVAPGLPGRGVEHEYGLAGPGSAGELTERLGDGRRAVGGIEAMGLDPLAAAHPPFEARR